MWYFKTADSEIHKKNTFTRNKIAKKNVIGVYYCDQYSYTGKTY